MKVRILYLPSHFYKSHFKYVVQKTKFWFFWDHVQYFPGTPEGLEQARNFAKILKENKAEYI